MSTATSPHTWSREITGYMHLEPGHIVCDQATAPSAWQGCPRLMEAIMEAGERTSSLARIRDSQSMTGSTTLRSILDNGASAASTWTGPTFGLSGHGLWHMRILYDHARLSDTTLDNKADTASRTKSASSGRMGRSSYIAVSVDP